MPSRNLNPTSERLLGEEVSALPLGKWRRNSAMMTEFFLLVLRSFVFAVHSEIKPSQLAEKHPGHDCH